MIRLIFFISLLSCFFISCENDQAQFNKSEIPKDMVLIPSGILSMGGDNQQADRNEYPKHKVNIKPFYMDDTEVTNSEFMKFVESTNYITVAERKVDWDEIKKQLPPDTPKPHDSILAPGALVFTATLDAVSLQNPQEWWRWTIGANWKHPLGPNSTISDKMDHPVVQIAWEDANAYCKWANKRLPTESEWEWASRGGKENMIYPWGNESIENGKPKANYYQGLFPYKNTLNDGFETTAPVKSYPPNNYGLYDMSGNVWEWCEDWFDTDYYKRKASKIATSSGPIKSNNRNNPLQEERVIRGGSFLCNDSYCSGYRNARRMGSTSDTGLNHTGCRCVR